MIDHWELSSQRNKKKKKWRKWKKLTGDNKVDQHTHYGSLRKEEDREMGRSLFEEMMVKIFQSLRKKMDIQI